MKDAKIIGIPLPLYLAIGVLLTVAMYVGALPGDFTGAFAIAVYWGSLFMWLGAKIPIVNTYMGDKAWQGKVKTDMIEAIPAHRFAETDEIAAAVLFLSCDESNMITGEDLVVDGGFTIK